MKNTIIIIVCYIILQENKLDILYVENIILFNQQH